MRVLNRSLSLFFAFVVLSLLVLIGCSEDDDAPIVETQAVMVENEEVVVTRVVRQTIEVPITPPVEELAESVALDISMRGTYGGLDPQQALNENALDIVENTFIGLTRFNHATSRPEPALARSWELVDEDRTWLFELRDDIFWVEYARPESGFILGREAEVTVIRPVVAADVVFAVQRACDPRVQTPDVFVLFIIAGCELVTGLGEVTQADLERIGIKAIDDTHLEITLVRPASHFLALTSTPLLRPVPAEVIVELGDDWHQPGNIVTSGPLLISPETLPDSRTVLVRNPAWPDPFAGNVDRVNILHLDSDADAYQLWLDRNLDLSPAPAEEINIVLTQHAQKTRLVSGSAVFYLAYNFESPVFSDPDLRQAFGWAIDRDRLIREVHDGQALPMRHFGPPGAFGAPPIDQVGMGYNPDRARRELDSSGIGDCRLLSPITYMVSASDTALQQAELLRSMWADELGCNPDQINIEQVQFGTLLAMTRPDFLGERPDMWDLGWSAYYPDENNWLGDVLHCIESENRQKRACGPVDQQITQANQLADQDDRLDLYRQIERDLFGENGLEPISPIYVRAEYLLQQTWLSFAPAHFGGEQYDTYRIDIAAKELERSR